MIKPKHAGGRPSTYNKEVLQQCYFYLENYDNEDIGDMIPSVEGLAGYINRARSTLHKWRGEAGKEEFSVMLDKINETQKKVLINKGLSGEFNSNITKLILGVHGFSEKSQRENTGEIKIVLSKDDVEL